MKFPKHKAIRLKGKKLHALYDAVYARDEGRCVRCRSWVEPGTPPHHIVFRSQGGSDTMENLELLCPAHHVKAHGIKIA